MFFMVHARARHVTRLTLLPPSNLDLLMFSILGKMLGFIGKKLLKCCSRPSIHLRSGHALFKLDGFVSSTAIVGSENILGESKGDAFIASYLVNSCGVTNAAAKRMLGKLRNMKSTEKPERVLKFFRSSGFNDAQISRIVTRHPALLLADPDKSLKPKFDIFKSVGASNDMVVEIFSKFPGFLTRSVDKGIVPMFDLLKSTVGSNQDMLNILTMYGSLWRSSVNTLAANVVALREMGMSDRAIVKLITSNTYALKAGPEKFKSMADRAFAMGFDLEKHKFGDAIRSFIAITEDNWRKKQEIYRKWGWSDSDFLMAFHKQPKIMLISVKNIEGIMKFMVDEMGVEASAVAKLPYVLCYNLENLIIPRRSVIQLLESRGLIEKKDCNFVYLMITEEQFLKRYVKKHNKIFTELMEVYSKRQLRTPTQMIQNI